MTRPLSRRTALAAGGACHDDLEEGIFDIAVPPCYVMVSTCSTTF